MVNPHTSITLPTSRGKEKDKGRGEGEDEDEQGSTFCPAPSSKATDLAPPSPELPPAFRPFTELALAAPPLRVASSLPFPPPAFPPPLLPP
eukprot:170727-Hanusia_phi.AAC.1